MQVQVEHMWRELGNLVCVLWKQKIHSGLAYACGFHILCLHSLKCVHLRHILPYTLPYLDQWTNSSFLLLLFYFCFTTVSTPSLYTSFFPLYPPLTFCLPPLFHNTVYLRSGPWALTLRQGFACRRFPTQACLQQHVQGKKETVNRWGWVGGWSQPYNFEISSLLLPKSIQRRDSASCTQFFVLF